MHQIVSVLKLKAVEFACTQTILAQEAHNECVPTMKSTGRSIVKWGNTSSRSNTYCPKNNKIGISSLNGKCALDKMPSKKSARNEYFLSDLRKFGMETQNK